ncbi:uncharacterized protein METZ01_LOCUS294482, partial [marine metagenome]
MYPTQLVSVCMKQRWDIAVTHNWIGISDRIFMHFRPLNLPFIEEKN